MKKFAARCTFAVIGALIFKKFILNDDINLELIILYMILAPIILSLLELPRWLHEKFKQ